MIIEFRGKTSRYQNYSRSTRSTSSISILLFGMFVISIVPNPKIHFRRVWFESINPLWSIIFYVCVYKLLTIPHLMYTFTMIIDSFEWRVCSRKINTACTVEKYRRHWWASDENFYHMKNRDKYTECYWKRN